MFYGSFGTQNSMVSFNFKLDPRKGQVHVKLGQIRSNFKITIFLHNMLILCSFVSGFQKCHLLLCTAITNAKACISNMWRHHLYIFLAIAQPKKLWNFVCVLFVCISIRYIPIFWDKWRILDYKGNYIFENRNFEFGGQNKITSKIWYSHF